MKSTQELQHWVSLLRVSGVGPKTFQKLLIAFASPEAILNANVSSLKKTGISDSVANAITSYDKNLSIPDMEWLEAEENHHIITLECDQYSTLLKQISSPPPLLYVHGNLSILNDPQLAIVGSRNPTQGGKTTAYDFAHHLAKTGLCISSGLALGVDGIAHQGAVDADAPTIAVIATGIDRVYPAKHRQLAHDIVEKGAIMSEFPIGVQAKPENFPRRNRIISGLSHGTLVIEAALQSGSLITARTAMEQGREVFAIPGSIHNPLARGCHQLIRQGAKLVETAEDILEEMAPLIELNNINVQQISVNPQTEQAELIENSESAVSLNSSLGSLLDPSLGSSLNPSLDSSLDSSLDKEQQQLLELMGFDPVAIDALVVLAKQPVEQVSAMLLMLELQNYVSASGNGTYTRLK